MNASRGGTDQRVPLPEVGLCSVCRHAIQQPNARGNTFWRCRRADSDPSLLRYPPLPRLDCHAFSGSE